MNTRSLAISAGVGGVVAGMLSAIPLVNCLNYVFCLWVWVGGILAVYLYTRMEQTSLSGGNGALIGAAAGLVGGLIVAGLALLFGMAAVGLSALADKGGSDSPLAMLATQGIVLILTIFAYLVIFPAIGALAGLVGVEMFGKPRPPAAMD